MLEIGMLAPDFTLPTDRGEVALSALRGQRVVVYFYPKDDTSGCTKEACDFRDHLAAFKDATVIGISKDTVAKHKAFRTKYELPFELASDVDGKVCDAYGVWVQKSMYGRTYFGIERSTFLINEKGCIEAIWRKVKVPGHVETVLQKSNKLS
jgi:peroxiredoxin Q/BCP